MKPPTMLGNSNFGTLRRCAQCGVALLLAAIGAISASAQIYYITARVTPSGAGPNLNTNPDTGNLLYNDGSFAGDTSAASTAVGIPPTSGSRYFSTAFSNSTPILGVTLCPSLPVAGAVYQVDHTFNSSAANISTNIILGVTNTANCTLSWTNTALFQTTYGNKTWQTLGFLTNTPGSSDPQITFYFVSGAVSAGTLNRMEMDAFRFTLATPCLAVAPPGMTGPLAAGLTNATVTGVAANATRVTVYQITTNGTASIGSLAVTNPAATVSVPVGTNLIAGAIAGATQTVGGQESCVPTAGILVGGGANPSLSVAFSIRQNLTNAGPTGAASSGLSADIYFLGATTLQSGAAPADATIVTPSTNWQTFTLQRGADPTNPTNPAVLWNSAADGANPNELDGDYGGLDGIAFTCQGDPGNLVIYIDDLANGTNGVFQNFEAGTPGAAYEFVQPSYSGTTSGNILSAPNETVIVTNTAYSGKQCLRVQWQFVDGQTNRWLRFVTAAGNPVTDPQVQLSEPISFKLLLLPVGAALPPPVQPGALSILQQGTNAVLSWSGSYPLQSCTNLATMSFTDVGVATAPYTNRIGSGARFYRLRSN